MKKYFAELPDSYVGGHVVKAPLANYTMRNGCPTAIKAMRDQHYRDVDGLYFAGDYMYTGSYESALNSGYMAACCINGDTAVDIPFICDERSTDSTCFSALMAVR